MKTLKLLTGIIMILVICYLAFLFIRNDIRDERIKEQKEKTIDSVFSKMDSINKYLGSCRDSTQYWSDWLTKCNFQSKEWDKYLLFSDRNAKRFIDGNKEFKKLDSIFNKVNK